MEMPILCPACKDPLVNLYIPTLVQSPGKSYKANVKDVLRKECGKRLNHTLYFRSYPGKDDSLKEIHLIDNNNKREVYWDFSQNRIIINSWNGKNIEMDPIILPLFEPDFSNLKALYNKLKLCITFS